VDLDPLGRGGEAWWRAKAGELVQLFSMILARVAAGLQPWLWLSTSVLSPKFMCAMCLACIRLSCPSTPWPMDRVCKRADSKCPSVKPVQVSSRHGEAPVRRAKQPQLIWNLDLIHPMEPLLHGQFARHSSAKAAPCSKTVSINTYPVLGYRMGRGLKALRRRIGPILKLPPSDRHQ